MKYINLNTKVPATIAKIQKEIEDIYPLPLWRMLLLSIYGSGKKYMIPGNKNITMPLSLEGYKFVSNMSTSNLQPDISVGMYKNTKGKKILVKIWHGVSKDYYYYTFINEIRTYLVINSVINRIQKSLPVNLKNVSIPNIIFVGKTGNQVIVAREYKNGTPAFYKSSNEKLVSYFKCIDFLSFIGKSMNQQEKNLITRRAATFYIFCYPIIFIKAIITYPENYKLFVQSIVPFIQSMLHLPADFKETLAHRDLHFKNIILSKKSVSIVDLQYCAFTDFLHELATTLRYRWKVDDFQNLFLKEIAKRYGNRKYFKAIFRGFIINSVIHGFTNKRIPKEKTDRWISLLEVMIRPNYINKI